METKSFEKLTNREKEKAILYLSYLCFRHLDPQKRDLLYRQVILPSLYVYDGEEVDLETEIVISLDSLSEDLIAAVSKDIKEFIDEYGDDDNFYYEVVNYFGRDKDKANEFAFTYMSLRDYLSEFMGLIKTCKLTYRVSEMVELYNSSIWAVLN